MKKLHFHIWQTLRQAHTCIAVLAFVLTPLILAHAEVYTEQGKRYYRCFGADFRLEAGRLSDAQAKKILRYVQDSYENNRLNKHMLDIWRNADDLYDGGKYHGKIMLTILKAYLNVAFDGYHTRLPSYRRYPGRTFEKIIPDFAWNYWGPSADYENTWCANDKKKLNYDYGNAYKLVPNLEKLVEIGERASTIRNSFNSVGCFRSPDEATLHARSYIKEWCSKDKISNTSAKKSASNVVGAIKHIYKTVSLEDSIFASGSYNHTLFAIIEQFPNTHRRYGALVSSSLYSEITKRVYNSTYGKRAKQKLLEAANKYNLQISRPSAREKAF